jgi:membrane protease subunit (stomatin/prohibitin family)|tara:strand:+ start:2508 stop:2786 length:279 start_codon:yes stop_codon:yes gene_type:complete
MWLSDREETMVCGFGSHINEIKNGTKLVVRTGQAAVFINEGSTSMADVFESGTHELAPANLPILSTLMGWKHDSRVHSRRRFILWRPPSSLI